MSNESLQPKRKRSLLVRMLMMFLGVVAVSIALVVAICAWDNHRSDIAWVSFSEEMEDAGFPVDKDLLFPPPPSEEQNFARVPFLKGLVDTDRSFVSTMDVLSSLTNVHRSYIPSNMPERSWRSGYAWTAEDVRLILLTRNAVQSPEPPLNAQGNLDLFNCFAAQFAELKGGLERPFSQFPIEFELGPQYPYLHLDVLHEISILLNARAVTYLHLGRNKEALEDIFFSWNLIHKLNADRTIRASLVGRSCFHYSLQPLWQGIATHQWSEGQLSLIQQELRRFDFIQSFKRNYLFETAWIAAMHRVIEEMWTARLMIPVLWVEQKLHLEYPEVEKRLMEWTEKAPTGWIRMNFIYLTERAFALANEAYQIQKHRIDPEVVKKKINDLEGYYMGTIHPDRLLGEEFFYALFDSNIPRSAASVQAFADMSLIACAIERFYVKSGAYPDSLQEVIGSTETGGVNKEEQGKESFPKDVVTGKPYIFLRTSGSFSLYSLAWDELNNFAQIGQTPSGMEDWVWPASDYSASGSSSF